MKPADDSAKGSLAAGWSPPDGDRPEAATEWFWETDPSHRYSYVSSQSSVATGLDRSQILGRRREDFAIDRDDPKWARHLADLEARRPFWRFEYSIRLPDGRHVHLSVSGEPRFDEQGRFLGYRGAASDITSRREIEDKLRQAKELFQAVLDHAPFGIVLKDRDGRYLEVSREWQRRFGVDRDRVVGKTSAQIMPPDLAETYRARDLATLTQGEKVVREERLQYPDRDDEYYLTTRFPTRDRDGNITGIGLISANITDRKLAELGQEESERQIRAITDSLPVLISRHDRDWRYRFINREGANWYGADASKIVGRSIQDMLSAETCDAIRPVIDRVLSGEPASYTGPIDYPDGKTRLVTVNYVPDRDADGAVQGWFAISHDMTEREGALRALQESEEERRTVTDNMPVLMARFDRDWHYRYINREGASWYGMAPDDVIGRTIADLFTPETVEDIRPSVEAALKGENAHYAGAILYPDGKTRNIEISFVPDRAPGGGVRGWFALAQDVSERKLAEQALRESEARLQAMMKYAPAGVYLKDLEGRFLVANPQYAGWFGQDIRDIIGKTSRELFPDSDASRYVDHDQAVIRERKFISMEDQARHTDGTVRTILINKFPILDNEGAVTAIGGVDLDITELKKIEQALRDSESQMRTIADNLPVFIAYLDNDMRYRFVNRTVEQWYRTDRAEIVGKRVRDVVLPDTYACLHPRMRTVLAGQRVSFEDSLNYPDGERRDVEISWIPDIDGSGRVHGWFALVQDITMRKRLENELVRRERLATMGQLTGTVAHELRNPLGAVASSMTTLRRRTEAAGLDVERSLSRAERGIGRCERIITELLDFARAKGQQREPTLFGDWISAVLAEQNIPTGIKLVTGLLAEDVEVAIDREDLRRAIINVLENAFQAVDGVEGGRIEIGCRTADGRLSCEILDNGPGIPPENLDRVTEPLFSTKSFGTGLGLPTVQRIMEEHGGGLEIESEPGNGALVRLWMPFGDKQE